MTAECRTTRIMGIGHVELRVRSLQDSARFYCDVLGLCCQETSSRLENQRVCVGVPASGCGLISVVLVGGFPPGAELAGLDHVGMSLSTEQDVRDIYARARELGYRATKPRMHDGHFQAFVFDPDGYKLEVFADRCAKPAESGIQSGSTDNRTGGPFDPDRYPPSGDSALSRQPGVPQSG